MAKGRGERTVIVGHLLDEPSPEPAGPRRPYSSRSIRCSRFPIRESFAGCGSNIRCSPTRRSRPRSGCGRFRASATSGFAAPISASGFMKTGFRPASRSPRKSAACAAHGRSKGKTIGFSSAAARPAAARRDCAMIEPGLYVGSVMHRRSRPVRRRFEYRVFWLILDLDRLRETASATQAHVARTLQPHELLRPRPRGRSRRIRCATRSRRWRRRAGSPPTGRCCL